MHQGVRAVLRSGENFQVPAGHYRRQRSRFQWGHRSGIKPYCAMAAMEKLDTFKEYNNIYIVSNQNIIQFISYKIE